jgi:hypothetical protein
METPDIISIAAELIVAATLLFAAASKLRNLPSFAEGLRGYALLPDWTVSWVARLVPAIEVALAAALLLGWAEPWPALMSAGLFGVFAVAIGLAVRGGRDIPCHCFGPSPKYRVGIGAMLRAVVLVALALIAAYSPTLGNVPRLPASLWSSEQQFLTLIISIQCMALAVILTEPAVLLIREVRVAHRRAPALRAEELRRLERTCGPKTVVEPEGLT